MPRQRLVFIGSLEVFFIVKSSRALHCIKPDFPSWKPIACGFSRDKKNEYEVFAPRERRRRKPENPVVKRRAKRAPPKFITISVFHSQLQVVCVY